MLSKSVIQLSVDGWGCVHSLLFTWSQTMVECWETAQEIPPIAKVIRKKPEGQRRDQASRDPPEPSRATTPKPESVCFTISCLSLTPLMLTGGYPQPHFSKLVNNVLWFNHIRSWVNKFLPCYSPLHLYPIGMQPYLVLSEGGAWF